MKEVYFDNAATTKIDERVIEAMIPYMNKKFGNPSSVHKWGRETKVMIEDARDLIAEFIGANSSEIYFTSGGTEANNWALKGLAFATSPLTPLQRRGESFPHIIATRIEHSSVLETLEYLRERFGFEVTYVRTNRFGEVNPDDISGAITDDTFLICMMHSNNELGIINDAVQLSNIANEKGIHLHTDSVQSIGKTRFNVKELMCTTATLSAHKIYGPKGIGALYIRKDTAIDKYEHGGEQERDRRGGTENVAAIAGFKKAVEILKSEMDKDIAHYRKLRERLLTSPLTSLQNIGALTINSPENGKYLHNIVNFSVDVNKIKIDPEDLLIKLDMKGIAVSSGSACTSGTIQPSHVLRAIGYDDAAAKCSLRISFGRYNTEEETDYFISVLRDILGT